MKPIEKEQSPAHKKETSIEVYPTQSRYLDTDIVNKKFYNVFNLSRLPEEYKRMDLTLGITSPNKGEGKTLVASNLAASLALGYKHTTVLVDLNIKNPSIHSIFGVDQAPGVSDSLENGTINLVQSRLKHLYIFPVGHTNGRSFGLQDLVPLRNILYALEQKFEFVIIDMASLLDGDFPALIANEVDGLLSIIDTESTKYQDIEKMYRLLNKNQIIGYIFNRVNDNEI